MGILDGKTAVITGGTRGLGLAIAQAYAAEGASVMVASRSESSVVEAVDALRVGGAAASGIPTDVGDRAQVEALAAHAVAQYGGFDVWVNNAGLSSPYGPTASIPVGRVERTLQTNIFGTYYGSLAALRHFLPRGAGKLINLAGRGERGGPVPLQNAYASSKAWVRSFTTALAKEYDGTGVGVFLFNPGLVRTEMLGKVDAIEGYHGQISALGPVVRRWGNDADVPAQRAVWLAGPETDGKTGLTVRVLGFPQIVGGLVRDALDGLTGRRAPDMPLDVTVVPSALPEAPTPETAE